MKLTLVSTDKTLGVCKKCTHISQFLRIVFKLPSDEKVSLELCITCLLSLLDEA
jgi:hypothetical protein